MNTAKFCTQCKHCETVFFRKALWQDHYAWHSTLQDQLHRGSGQFCGPFNKQQGQTHPYPRTGVVDKATHLISRLKINNSQEDEQKYLDRIIDIKIGKDSGKLGPKSDTFNLSLTDAQIEQSLKRIIDDFPPDEGDGCEKAIKGPRLSCLNCDFLFDSSAQLDEHQLSKYCKGSNVIVHIMIVDSSSPGNYRIEQEGVPFESNPALFKCTKCDEIQGATPIKIRQHMESHWKNPVPCLHCQKIFPSQYELEEHYDWHDNIHIRHHIDAKQNSTSPNKLFQEYKFSGGGEPQTKQEKPPIRNPWTRKGHTSQTDGDIVAISFVSGGDLERRYAPDGKLIVPLQDSYSMIENINLSDLSKAMGKINSPANLRKSKSSTLQHDQETEHTTVRRIIDWELSFADTPRGWVLARDDRKWLEFYPAEARIINDDNRVGGQDILDDIVLYAQKHPIVDFKGLENIIDIFPDHSSRDNIKIEQLRHWLKREKELKLHDDKSKRLPPSLRIHGYGSRDNLLVRDSSGRSRYVTGRDLCEILSTAHCSPDGDLPTIRLARGIQGETALERGDILTAEDKYLQLLQTIRTFKGDPQLEFLGYMHLAMNVYKANQSMKKAAGMYVQSLGISQRLYGIDHINNFTILSDLASYYSGIGRENDAAALLRRSIRGRLSCDDQERALQNKQDLARIHMSLENQVRAVQLFEETYDGFEQVLGPEHRTTLVALNNLAAAACSTGSLDRGRSLLLSAIPRLQDSLGPEDEVSWSSICNFLSFADNGHIPNTIMPAIQAYFRRNHPTSLKVIKSLADFYGRNGLIRKAAETYKSLSERTRALNNPPDEGILDALYGEAYALEKLGDDDEAVKKYYQLLFESENYTGGPQRWGAQCDAAVKSLSQRQKAISLERQEWGMNTPAKCSMRGCNRSCVRFCSGCKIVRFCSEACEVQDTRHKDICLPTLAIGESISVRSQDSRSQPEIDYMATLLKQKMLLPRLPTCVSAKTIFIDPLNFATVRFSKGPTNILTFQPAPEADIRFMLFNASELKWSTPSELRMVWAYPIEDCYMVVTPGTEMLKNLIKEREKSAGVKLVEMEIPDKELIEYAQSAAPMSGRFRRAFKVTEWAP